MNDGKQDNEQVDSSNDDAVVEQRVVKKQGSSLIGLIVFGLLIGVGVAAGYYHSMWLPQAKQLLAKYVPAQKEVDLMAAPALDNGDSKTEDNTNEMKSEPSSRLPAITKKQPVEETSKEPAEVLPVIPSTTSLIDNPVLSNDVADVANDIVLDAEPLTKEAVIESVKPEEDVVSAVIDTGNIVAKENVVPEMKDTGTVNIAQARQAFWARDLVKAEAQYRKLIESGLATADVWGELGNLYYSQAKWQKAADAYSEAAIQLLSQGKYQQAMFLHYLVRGLDPAQAARIDEKLRAMQAIPLG